MGIVLGAIATAVFAFAATTIFLNWKSEHHATNVEIIRGSGYSSSPIDVIDGDTVRMNGTAYRLIAIDTPERGDKARCDDERRRAEKATQRLRDLIADGNAHLTRVACSCRPGEEGTHLQLRATVWVANRRRAGCRASLDRGRSCSSLLHLRLHLRCD